ncbi:MAG TPA: Arm DNA-binding domain-containing protein, partial [Stellaceae bacterium]|nr:Arm DNA-binding domain-containing protein [Stellaceae bacterium]
MAQPEQQTERKGGRPKGHLGIWRLADNCVKTEKREGMHADGGGLYLRVAPGGSKSWMFRYMRNGKAHNMGLGSTDTYTLAEARERARAQRQITDTGHDPITVKAREVEAKSAAEVAAVARIAEETARAASIKTFAEAARECIAFKAKSWKDRTEAGKWEAMLANHAAAIMGQPVGEIDTPMVLRLIEPLWHSRQRLARVLQHRIETVLGYATVHGYRQGDNPAQWKGLLDGHLPTIDHEVEHRAALPWQEVPAFIGDLRRLDNAKSAAME